MRRICVIGGGSVGWTPTLLCDLMHALPGPLELRLHDIDPPAARRMQRIGKMIAARLGRHGDRLTVVGQRSAALRDADAVLITISTGGLSAMRHDLAIPQRYGIMATVGDTAGPGGWARAVRNIPVFVGLARDVARFCPTALIVNYTNPMAALTATLQQECANPVVGLCHAVFETRDAIQQMFRLKDWGPISLEIAGMNHFTWVTRFRVGRADGYARLRRELRGRSLRALLPRVSADELGHRSGHELCAELYDAHGYLCYPADRHTSEFLSFPLANRSVARRVTRPGEGPVEVLEYAHLVRTSIANRRRLLRDNRARVQRWLRGREMVPAAPSRETGAPLVAAYLDNRPVTDAVNSLNRGQIPGLPAGACVETMGTVDGGGIHPHAVDPVPAPLLERMRPQANCQAWTTQGMRRADAGLLLEALYHDPACAHLAPRQIRRMAGELVAAHRRFLPAWLRQWRAKP